MAPLIALWISIVVLAFIAIVAGVWLVKRNKFSDYCESLESTYNQAVQHLKRLKDKDAVLMEDIRIHDGHVNTALLDCYVRELSSNLTLEHSVMRSLKSCLDEMIRIQHLNNHDFNISERLSFFRVEEGRQKQYISFVASKQDDRTLFPSSINSKLEFWQKRNGLVA